MVEFEYASFKFNKYQTPLTQELKDSVHPEIWTDLIDTITSVEFIKRLIAHEDIRGFAKDRPRDDFHDDGRILVDIVNPHILEDMDFFRERALHFNKHGRYTLLQPNGNTKSEYATFWKEELKKFKHGVVRESDGEWIPGQLYFYWNYSPIWLSVDTGKINKRSGKVRAERRKEFAKPWLGDYLFYHYMEEGRNAGMHGKLLKTRGCGFSFKMGSISPCNMYALPGSGNPNFHLASDKGFLSGDKGIWGKVVDTLDWMGTHTPLPRMRLTNDMREMKIQLGFQNEFGIRKGLLSSVFGISLKDNPDKARGVRGPLIHYEEDGLFPNLEDAWNINLKAVEDGDSAFGYMLAGGTGGTEGASFAGSEKLFYAPQTYNILGVPNVYDKNTDGSSLCGFFWGGYLNRNGCYDLENGEPDVIKALVEILKNRFTVKYNSIDPRAITQKKAEEPITPQEAVMRTQGTVFNVADIKEYLASIRSNLDSFISRHYTGVMLLDSEGKVFFKPDSSVYPLLTYNKNTSLEGGVEIYEMPKINGEGVVPYGRYIAGIDTIDADKGKSLFSLFIMDTFTDRIVAEYSGRPRYADEAYEIALRLLSFYNAQANYEKNLKGLFTYFNNHNKLYLLADTPKILKDMDMIKEIGYGNNSKGTHAVALVNSWARLLQAEWLDKPLTYNTEEDEEKTLRNLHKMRNIAYLEEASLWNADGNFDRVSAMGMLMILREDRFKTTNMLRENGGTTQQTILNDSFFKVNYDLRNKNAINKTINY